MEEGAEMRRGLEEVIEKERGDFSIGFGLPRRTMSDSVFAYL